MVAKPGRGRGWPRVVAGVALLALLGGACEGSDGPGERARPGQVESEKGTEAVVLPEAEAIDAVGVYALAEGGALAIAPGLSWTEAQALIEAALAARLIRMQGSQREQRMLRGQSVAVRIQTLEPLGRSEVGAMTLTFFAEHLVGVVVHYRTPGGGRLQQWQARYGRGQQSEAWTGWWLREQGQVVQAKPDGMVYEVFDLGVARAVVPEIDAVMAESWRRRYGDEP